MVDSNPALDAEALLADLDRARDVVRSRTSVEPRVAVVLGSGLGALADEVKDAVSIPYGEIPAMPQPRVAGHAGRLVVGKLEGVPVVLMSGRAHLYEGHHPTSVVFGARLMARLGARATVITNAAGGIDHSFRPGDLMVITDHLNLLSRNPLVGPNLDGLGPRFPDMTCVYDRELAAAAREAASEMHVELKDGIYAALLGPSYETPAEIRMLRTLGASAIGMSTVPEAIALRHMGVRVIGLSCITNLAAGMGEGLLDHREVEDTAKRIRSTFVPLIKRIVEKTNVILGETTR